MIVLSRYQVADLVQARKGGVSTLRVSPDLGLTWVETSVAPEGVRYPGGRLLGWEDVARIAKSKVGCFQLLEDGIRKIQVFSEETGRPVSLMPTEGAPTLLLAGFPMHRIKGIEPMQDTRMKIEALMPLSGRVLDTATGLGYTAIELAKCVDAVVTIELDPSVIDVARLNPWSRDLFADPKIERLMGDSFDLIETFEAASFDHILHDPPTFSLAGDLYSQAFYREMLRVLKSGGRLFHYVGDLKSRSGRNVGDGVMRRLRQVGFKRVKRRVEAFGVAAYKGH